VGETYAHAALPILQLLAVAQVLRMVGNPYGTVLVATGLQSYAIPLVLVEGFTNLLLSLWFAFKFGAIGVAVGTLAASALALSLTIFWLMPRVKPMRVSGRDFFQAAVLKPLLVFSPLIAWLASRAWLARTLESSGTFLLTAPMIAGMMTLGLFVGMGTMKRKEPAV
jgi:O-antigen/teichoic acid export membrane protein